MKRACHVAVVFSVAAVLSTSALTQTPPEPGATPGVVLTNISRNTPMFASVFPKVAISRSDPNLIAVAWRRYGLPVDTNALKEARHAECHVAISRDGGKTFTHRNMMDVLRTTRSGSEPELWGCNAPWVAIANDGTMYFGGALFTAGGELQAEPKAGRAAVTVSSDGGNTWSKMIPAVTIARLAPGLTGLEGGMEQHHTPWDGPNGFVDASTAPSTALRTSRLYVTVGRYITKAEDKLKTLGTVYEGKGTTAAAFGKLVAARTITEQVGYACPCLVAAVSTDEGVTWTDKVIAQANEYNREGTVRYPIAAASPAHDGHFSVVAYQPDHRTVKVYYTRDAGKTWKMATPRAVPEDVSVNYASQAGVGYTTDGALLVTWRGFRNPGAFNTFVAMFQSDAFGPTIKVSPELSIYPPLTYAGNYGNGNGAGDFTTWVEGNEEAAFVAFPFAPKGEVEDTYLARVPLTILSADTSGPTSPTASSLSGDILRTSQGEVVIHPVSHASFAMSSQDRIIYVDPVGGLAPYAALPKPDLVVLTHGHGDHTHADTLSAIVQPHTRIIAPAAVRQALPGPLQARVMTLANGDSITADGVAIEAVAMYNTTSDRLRYHPKGTGNGYVMRFGDKRLYIPGDTEATPEMLALKEIDVAFLPMNLPFTMTVEKAADAARTFRPKVVYPYHSRGSDVDEFALLLAAEPGIEVRLRKWY
jgi:L-ascorbate metabolism protein UlaG (beta-lactamase superfamily)